MQPEPLHNYTKNYARIREARWCSGNLGTTGLKKEKYVGRETTPYINFGTSFHLPGT